MLKIYFIRVFKGKYKAYVVEKYGDVGTLFDYDGWIQASGGMNKGKLYGLNSVSDPLALMTGIPSTECSITSYEYGSESLEVHLFSILLAI